MRTQGLILIAALLLSACGARPVRETGAETPKEVAPAPPRSNGEDRLVRLENALNEADSVPIRTVAKVLYAPKNGKSIALRADIRTVPDSLFWVDVSDPILGIKVARAVLTRDTALAYSRLQNMWLAESPDRLMAYAGLPLTFDLFLDLWSGRPALNGYTCGCAASPVFFDDAGTGPVWKFDYAEGLGQIQLVALPEDAMGLQNQQVTTPEDTYRANYLPGKGLVLEWSGGQITVEFLEQYRTGVTFPFQIPEGLERFRL